MLFFFINPIGASEVDPGCIDFKPGDQPIHNTLLREGPSPIMYEIQRQLQRVGPSRGPPRTERREPSLLFEGLAAVAENETPKSPRSSSTKTTCVLLVSFKNILSTCSGFRLSRSISGLIGSRMGPLEPPSVLCKKGSDTQRIER